ncbi:MAG TPA: hypothetical protein VJ417_03370, partial [Candidatus Glassbacteria bacterium]|nr:hypothetical protein [Candidatus Glassbacteria bacterium]
MPGNKITVAAVLAARPEYAQAREFLHAWTGEAARCGARCICFPEYYFDLGPAHDGKPASG